MKLTRNNDDTLEIMLKAREGVIGEPCKRETEHQKFRGDTEYNLPGMEAIKSSVGAQSDSLILLTIIQTCFNDLIFYYVPNSSKNTRLKNETHTRSRRLLAA